jgi:hypothetical protein
VVFIGGGRDYFARWRVVDPATAVRPAVIETLDEERLVVVFPDGL